MAGQVHDLPPEQAARGIPVHLTATVTYYDPSENTLFIADASGAVYVRTTHPYNLRRGDLVKVDGITAKSFRTTVAADPRIQVVGTGSMGRTRVHSFQDYRELMSGKWDCQYVTMEGLVRSATVERHGSEQVLELEIMMHGGLIQAYVQHYGSIDVDELTDATVEISGVIGGEFNAKWQLMRSMVYASDAKDLKILRKPPTRTSSLPLTAINEVMQTHSVEDRTRRVRVRGTVTFYRPGQSIVVQQDGRSLFATTRQETPIPLGAVVDLVGFASEGGYSPFLEQTKVLPTGSYGSVLPVPLNYAQTVGGEYSDDLISLRGQVISLQHAGSTDTLFVMVDNHAVTVVLQAPANDRWLTNLPTGAVLSVVGICRITPTSVWGAPGTTPMIFRIELRSKDDIEILSRPTWWTVQHLLFLMTVLLGLSISIAVWALLLRRRVADQTANIKRSMKLEKERSTLLEAINSVVPLEQLIERICRFVTALAPELQCCCILVAFREETIIAEKPRCIGDSPEHILFDSVLTDNQGLSIGHLRAGVAHPKMLNEFEAEVLAVAAGLASLSFNQRRMYQELSYTSTHDQLTAVLNRRAADTCLQTAMQNAASTKTRIAVSYIDVDRFKEVNDHHGHRVGDLYLQQIAARLAGAVRTGDRVARIGGDEFLVVGTGLASIDDAKAYRSRLESCFEQDFALEENLLRGSVSIGIAVYPDHGVTSEELKRHADADMYAAKHRRRLERPEPDMDIFSQADLEAALRKEQFTLFYQPQFSAGGQLHGLEALVRLNDPILGIVTPDAFIGTAERSDFILALGAWVLRQALSDAVKWRLNQMTDVRMVVNVSARQVEHPQFADEVEAALQVSGLPASNLELEITERAVVRDVGQATAQLNRLRSAGVRIAIDDFGTEHSCLSSLHKLPVDTLKIDRSFLQALSLDPKAIHIIEAIVTMARSMHRRVVAEGVETQEQVETLLLLGNMDFQGYFFGHPQPAEGVSSNMPTWCSGLVTPR